MRSMTGVFVGWSAGALVATLSLAACQGQGEDVLPGVGGDSGSGATSGTSAGGSGATGGKQGSGGSSGGTAGKAGAGSGGAMASSGGSGGGSGGSGATGGNGATGGGGTTGGDAGSDAAGGNAGADAGSGGSGGVMNPLTDPEDGPPAGNAEGNCDVPAEAGLEDVSSPDQVVGDGTKASCTGAAVIAAVAAGGVITFDCGPDPVTIMLDAPAKVFNDASDSVVIDGGGLVTLSGSGKTRILYMNTCDEAQHWTTSHCNDQEFPELTVQNITFVNGNSKSETENDGGGAIYASGGRFKLVNTRFFNNVCADTGPDVGGAAVRAFQQYQGKPVYVVNSTFGGAEGYGNTGSNGGGISSIGVSWTIINSLFSYNHAIGDGGNPAQSGTPGGGSGGAIYNDGNTMTLTLCGVRIEHNEVNAYGSAIFFVSNDHSGNIVIDDSVITNNVGGSWYPTYPQISNHDDTPITVTSSTIQ